MTIIETDRQTPDKAPSADDIKGCTSTNQVMCEVSSFYGAQNTDMNSVQTAGQICENT